MHNHQFLNGTISRLTQLSPSATSSSLQLDDGIEFLASLPPTANILNQQLTDLSASLLNDGAAFEQLLTGLCQSNLTATDSKQLFEQLMTQSAGLNNYHERITELLAPHLSNEQLQSFHAETQAHAQQIKQMQPMLNANQSPPYTQAFTGTLGSIQSAPPPPTMDMTASNSSYFAVLISVLLYCYNSSSEYGKVMLGKLKDSQSAAASVSDLEKMLLDLKGLVATNPDATSLYQIFAQAFGDPMDPATNEILSKYQDQLSKITGPKLDNQGNPVVPEEIVCYFDCISNKGPWQLDAKDNQYMFVAMLNGCIDQVNQQLLANGISPAGTINHFDTSDPSLPCASESDRNKLNETFSSQIDSCDSDAGQLITLNQNLQALISQTTETIKALLEWLKQSIQGYGTAINPR